MPDNDGIFAGNIIPARDVTVVHGLVPFCVNRARAKAYLFCISAPRRALNSYILNILVVSRNACISSQVKRAIMRNIHGDPMIFQSAYGGFPLIFCCCASSFPSFKFSFFFYFACFGDFIFENNTSCRHQ